MQAASQVLRLRIFGLRRKSISGRTFYCPAQVRDTIRGSADTVVDYLGHLPGLRDSPLDVALFAALVQSSAPLIFASLLLDGNGAAILGFVHRRYVDEQLPFVDEALMGFLPELERGQFLERQWEFCPRMLMRDGVHQEIGKDWILPFLRKWELGSGASAVVSKVSIPTTCQGLVDSSEDEVEVALKVLKGGDIGNLERVTLNLVCTLKHQHIINFLGSYTYQNEFTFIFPAAAMNLRKFLIPEGTARPDISTPSLYANIHGLADALSSIHNFSSQDYGLDIARIGYHHDLRPENILLVQHEDDDASWRFVISDFGLSRLKSPEKDSKTPLKGGHDDYLGPESFDHLQVLNGDVGRALDVWAFGCVVAELATLIAGRSSVAAFREARRARHAGPLGQTDCAFHLNRQVRPSVVQWLDDLHKDGLYPLPQLVDLVREMLNPNPCTRHAIGYFTPKLHLLAVEAAFIAVDGQLSDALSGTNDDESGVNLTSDSEVFVFLEQKRIKAWHTVFVSLGQETRLSLSSQALAALQHLGRRLSATNILSEAEGTLSSETLDAVDALSEALPNNEVQHINRVWRQSVCEINNLKVLEAIRNAAKPDRYRLVGISAAMRHMSSVVSKAIRFGGSRIVDLGCVDVDDDHQSTHVSPTDKSKTMGFFTDDEFVRQRVLVEWKAYDVHWKDRATELQVIMDGLVNLLDEHVTPRPGAAADRISSCLGYFHQQLEHRFGFLYSLPTSLSGQNGVHLFSLHHIISRTAEARRDNAQEPPLPDLGDVFDVAKDLSSCLLAVHEAGWLHENITSHQVLVFTPGDSHDTHRYMASSFVLSGFNDSRPEAASSATLGPSQSGWLYRHQAYRTGVPFRRSFDYYGLGLVLLELGLWVTVSELRAVDHRDMDMEGFRRTLLDDYVPQLGERMGARYRKAVRFCLDAENVARDVGVDGENTGSMHELFKTNVVDMLARCCA